MKGYRDRVDKILNVLPDPFFARYKSPFGRANHVGFIMIIHLWSRLYLIAYSQSVC